MHKWTHEGLVSHWLEVYRAKSGAIRKVIRQIADEYPIMRAWTTDFETIANLDYELADHLLSYPRASLAAAEQAITDMLGYKSVPLHVRVEFLPSDVCRVQLRDIRHNHLGQLIAVEGLIRKVTEVRPRILTAMFRCERCRTIFPLEQDDTYLQTPIECPQCHKHPGQTRFAIITEPGERDTDAMDMTRVSTFVDTQVLEVQETPEALRGSENPHNLELRCEDDLTGIVSPGDRLIVNGILRSKPRGRGQTRRTYYDYYLQVISIETQTREFEEIEISIDDIEAILEASRDPNIKSKIVRSIAPTIYGMTDEKTAMALQLFGGVSKDMEDGTRARGDIHILLVGDPGVAKSQLLIYVSKLAPRGLYTSGKASSGPGLTAAAVKGDEFGDGRWTLEAGALVLADRGICCIDELDKMNPKDRDSIHTAMEQQSISIAKAGITATLQTRCSILAAANPIMGRFDPRKLFPEQIELDPPLLTRFDVIFLVYDWANEDRDRALANHVTHIHARGEARRQATKKDIASPIEAPLKDTIPDYEPDFLRKYIAYAKTNIFPVMTQEARTVINETYVSIRKSGNGTIPLTPRNIEAMIRLAEAHARLHLRDEVTEEDALTAINIIQGYLRNVAMGENGKVDMDIITTGYAASQRDRIFVILEIIKDIQGRAGASVEDIKRMATERGIPESRVDIDLERLKRDGRVYEKSEDHYITT